MAGGQRVRNTHFHHRSRSFKNALILKDILLAQFVIVRHNASAITLSAGVSAGVNKMAIIKKLTDKAVKALSEPGRHSDGGNLYLQITKTGAKSWLFVYRWGSKQKEMGLGPLLSVSLADAREEADKARKALAKGVDPMAARKAVRDAAQDKPDFGPFAEQVVSDLESQWRNEKHRAQWKYTLKEYGKAIWDMPVDQIDTEAVLSVLKPIWQTIPETASRVRGRIEKVLDAAAAKGLRQGVNPARWRGHLDHLLPKRQKLTRGHHAAMPYDQVSDFVADLRTREAVSACALEFLILCASRSGEVLGMTWDEADLENRVWAIPADRMKAGREHRVPLTDRALAILKKVKPLQGADKSYVFPGRGGRALSVMSLTMQMRRMAQGNVTPHGFRSAFRDWAGEVSTFPREIAEAALAHTVGDATERAYRRGDALEKRRLMMDSWAQYIEPKSADRNVVELRKA